MGKALSGELSCPCDKSSFVTTAHLSFLRKPKLLFVINPVLQMRRGNRDNLGILVNFSIKKYVVTHH